MDYIQYIKPEMFILVPVLWLIGLALKKTPKMQDWLIPYILGGVSIFLCGIWVSVSEGLNPLSIFTAVTQGILVAGTSVWGNQLVRQAGKKNDGKEE